MPISIKDVARLAGVSHTTVSRALSNTGVVNAKTAEHIRRIAQEVGYRPNSIGRSLATRQTRTLGVVVTTVADPFVAEMVTGIEDVVHNHGYAVFLANSNADPEREISVVRSFQEHRVDGVIVMASRVGSLYMPVLKEMKVPIVLVNNQHPGEFVHSIGIDDRAGSSLAVRHLVELGHCRIAYIGDRYGQQSDRERLAGYKDELERVGSPFWAELVAYGDGMAEGGQVAMSTLLALRHPPTAVFCYNDLTAIGALRCLHAAGLELPAALSVVGFDDLPIASFVEPPLTTIRQPKADMGRSAARLLLDLLDGNPVQSVTQVQGELIVRKSTTRPMTV